MLPPIPVPDAAARLTAMAQQSALAPIQQAGGMRGQAIMPPSVAPQGGIMDGIPGLMAGVKDLAGMVKQNKEAEALAAFVKSAIGEQSLPEGATPVEGMPWLQESAPQAAPSSPGLPPIPPMGGAVPASANPSQQPAAQAPAPGSTVAPNQRERVAAAGNPLGFDDRQVAILRGMIETGDPAQVERAAGLVMTRAFAAPPEAKSALGKLLDDYKKLGGSNPQMAKWYEAAIEKEVATEGARPPQTRTVTIGDKEVTQEWDRAKQAYVDIGEGPRWQPDKARGRDERVLMLMETGLDENTAKNIASGRYTVSRDPISGNAQIVDVGTGQIVGKPSPGQQAAPEVPAPQISVPSAADGADYSGATGMSGFFGGIVNTITDAMTGKSAAPGIEKASQALSNLQTQTMLSLADAFPGRPSNLVREELRAMSVTPGSVFQGDARSKEKLQQTRNYVDTAIRAQQSIITNSDQHTPQQVAEARQKVVFFNDLLGAYDTVIDGFGKKPAKATESDIPSVTDAAGYEALPPGSRYRDPQGNIRVKSGAPR